MPDMSKTLKVVDGENRELFISLGCAVENMQIAATHYGYESDYEYINGNIVVTFRKSENVTPDPLFAQIKKRHTHRGEFTGEKIPSDLVTILQNVEKEQNTDFAIFDGEDREFRRMPEMLEYFVVFTCDCDFHWFSSRFWNFAVSFGTKAAAPLAADRFRSVPPFGLKGSAVQQRKGDLPVRGVEQTLKRSAGNVHLPGRPFLRMLLQIAETQSLQLIHRDLHHLGVVTSPEPVSPDPGTDFAFFLRSRHDRLLFLCICT